MRPLDNLRNFGISAHIDSGKTTLTERILYYTGIIHQMHEVRGKDGVGATMDYMDLERERGITITSAATHCKWDDYNFNIIDTPGHVDFTIEVERALRVLDGAILVLCGVSGVQSQSYTVDRQMSRYKVPRIAFINKLDRVGANPGKVVDDLITKLGHNAVALQIPIGLEEKLQGVVDLVRMKAYFFKGEGGRDVEETEIPSHLKNLAEEQRENMLDSISEFSDELTDCILEGTDISTELIQRAIRKGALERKLTPVLMGSAFKNIGVQPLMDAIGYYLPNPYEVDNFGLNLKNAEKKVKLEPVGDKPLVAYIFKLEDGPFGQLNYARIYQGSLKKGKIIQNMTTKKKRSIGRLVRMHTNQMEDITIARAGDIVAIFGLDCASGTTFTDGKVEINMTSMHVPEPVIGLVIEAQDRNHLDNLTKGLRRFMKEDPTFKVKQDKESNQTIISGMGELHLEVYLERLRREYKVQIAIGKPQVAYRESISQRADFSYTLKKQTGGAGQFAKVVGYIEPADSGESDFVNQTRGGVISADFIAGCERGFKNFLESGDMIGFPVYGLKLVLTDGETHSVDSSALSFQIAIRDAILSVYKKACPEIMEPLMKVEVETPIEFQGSVLGNLNQRRGMISGTEEAEKNARIMATVPLAEMFGYATDLRSQTQGKAEFTMEFAEYALVPPNIKKGLLERFGGLYY